jgi:hypothetical protein
MRSVASRLNADVFVIRALAATVRSIAEPIAEPSVAGGTCIV